MVSQELLKDLIFDTVANAELAGRLNEFCYVQETRTYYEYKASAGTYTRDGLAILNTVNSGNTRWLSRAGKYFVDNFLMKQAGVSGATNDQIEMTNSTATIVNGGTGILWNLHASDANSYDAGRIAVLGEGTWTSTASTQDSTMQFSTALNGTVAPKITILSSGFTGFGVTDPKHQVHVLNTLKVSDVGQNSGIVILGDSLTTATNVGMFRGSATATVGGSSWLILSGFGGLHLTAGAAAFGAQNVGLTLLQSGDIGIGTITPSSRLDIEKAGTVTATTDLLELTNTANAASMTNTGTSILFNQWAYDASSPAVRDAVRLRVITEGNWTTASENSQDAALIIESVKDGAMGEHWRFESSGNLLMTSPGGNFIIMKRNSDQTNLLTFTDTTPNFIGYWGVEKSDGTGIIGTGSPYTMLMGHTTAHKFSLVTNTLQRLTITGTGDIGIGTTGPSSFFDIEKAGTVTATTDLLELTNSGNAASMTATGTGILFNQWYYDGVTPAVADAGRIACITEGSWTSTASTQDSAMIFQTADGGTVAERTRLTSVGGRVYTPTGDHTVVAATGIIADWLSYISRLTTGGGAVDITANPQIVDGIDGQIIIFQGTSDANTVQFDDGNGLQLQGGANMVLGLNDILCLMFDVGSDLWIELYRSNN